MSHEATSGNIEEFSKASKDLIVSLQQDNKNLREELSGKEKELFSMTKELSRITGDSGNVSEQFLIASLQAARESISSLDVANQELLDALSSRQEEIMRLSTAGMALQARYFLASFSVMKNTLFVLVL